MFASTLGEATASFAAQALACQFKTEETQKETSVAKD